VYAIFEEDRGVNDQRVLELAVLKKSLLLTQDKDFGNLVINLGLPNFGILLLRFGSLSIDEKLSAIQNGFIDSAEDLVNKFSVLDGRQLRIRDL
tara:strand:- start:265 stop:546 length:282 start_codon:yes stop_codon:yes gene_type:complete